MQRYDQYETVSNPEIYTLNPYGEEYLDTFEPPTQLYSDDQYTTYSRPNYDYDDYSPDVVTYPKETIYDYQPQSTSYAAPPTVPFYGSTTTRDAYQWKDPITPRETRQRTEVSEYNMNRVPFYGETTTQAEYVKKIPLPINNYKPPAEYSSPTVPFYSTTTHREEFNHKKVEKRQIIAKEDTAGPPNIKFDDETTHKVHYPPREVTRTKLVRPKQTVGTMSDERMFVNTTHQIEFTPKEGTVRSRPVRQRGHDFFNEKQLTNYKTETTASFQNQEPTKNCPAEALINSGNMRARHVNGHWFVARMSRRPTSQPNIAKTSESPASQIK